MWKEGPTQDPTYPAPSAPRHLAGFALQDRQDTPETCAFVKRKTLTCGKVSMGKVYLRLCRHHGESATNNRETVQFWNQLVS